MAILQIRQYWEEASKWDVVHVISNRACAYLPSPEMRVSTPVVQSRPPAYSIGSAPQNVRAPRLSSCVPPWPSPRSGMTWFPRQRGRDLGIPLPGPLGCIRLLLDSDQPGQVRHFTS